MSKCVPRQRLILLEDPAGGSCWWIAGGGQAGAGAARAAEPTTERGPNAPPPATLPAVLNETTHTFRAVEGRWEISRGSAATAALPLARRTLFFSSAAATPPSLASLDAPASTERALPLCRRAHPSEKANGWPSLAVQGRSRSTAVGRRRHAPPPPRRHATVPAQRAKPARFPPSSRVLPRCLSPGECSPAAADATTAVRG